MEPWVGIKTGFRLRCGYQFLKFLQLWNVSHGLMRHADSAPSVYGRSRLWLRNFQPIKARQWMTFREAKPLSHSIELPYTESAESACLISPWDKAKSIERWCVQHMDYELGGVSIVFEIWVTISVVGMLSARRTALPSTPLLHNFKSLYKQTTS